jgi:ADP-ribose pyrophosphatase YjhB (NUDIX family)
MTFSGPQIKEANQRAKQSQIERAILVAVDCVIFGFEEGELKILLVKRDFEGFNEPRWSLMGGYVDPNENLENASKRILFDLTGLDNVYLDQVKAFGKINRDPRYRTISVGYYSLINIQAHTEMSYGDERTEWFNFKEIPDLIFDHASIVQEAIGLLRHKASTGPIGFELLPTKFTMNQLLKLYEAIYDQELDVRNFSKRINQMDVLIKLDEKDMSTSRRGSFLFQFDKEKYQRRLDVGMPFKL